MIQLYPSTQPVFRTFPYRVRRRICWEGYPGSRASHFHCGTGKRPIHPIPR